MIPDEPLSKQLIETFSIELGSLLAVITSNLQKIKSGKAITELTQINEEISRSGRNIKVSALSIGLTHLGRIADYIEKLFSSTQEPKPEIVNLAFQAVDGMREALQDFIEKKSLSSHLRDLIDQLQHELHLKSENTSIIEEIPVSETTIDESYESTVPTIPIDQDFFKKILETFKAELQENLIIITDGLLQLEKNNKSEKDLSGLFEGLFRAAHNIKGSSRSVGAVHVGDIAHQIETLFAGIQKKDIKMSPEMVDLCLKSIDYMNEAMRCFSEEIPLSFDLQNHLQQLQHYIQFPQQETALIVQSTPAKILEPEDKSKFAEAKTKVNEFESIRVSLQNLDKISADMEEVQAIKIILEEHYSDLNKINFKIDYFIQSWKKNVLNLKNIFDSDPSDDRLDALFSMLLNELSEISNAAHLMQQQLRMPVNELSTLLNELQDEIRMTRLIPVNSQLRYLPRNVRDLAQELKKQVTLKIKNNDVKIDKMILDGLKDPLMHLLRNAIDHGIECSEVRQAEGKSIPGTIDIDVSQEDHQIVFKISDDGAGINEEDLARIALKKNMITQAELGTMKSDDILDLIFLPGFSTREFATDISGRGVGLDVVRSNLTHLKGQVSVESELGKGTVFWLRVPITLATERGLIVLCGEQTFVIITVAVESVFLLKKQDIVNVEGSSAVLVKKEPVLLCSLSRLLHLDENTQENKEQLSVVILKKDKNRIALLVDEIIGEREIVLKPLQEPLTTIPCVVGATLTGSNQINFVLNSSEIIKRALL